MGIPFEKLSPQLQERIRQSSPDAFRKVEARRPEQAAVSALDGGIKERKASKGGVAVRVTMVACRHRLTDDDALAYSCKPLRDAISNSLGLDDADARIKFEYGQLRTDGEQGVIVKIETELCKITVS